VRSTSHRRWDATEALSATELKPYSIPANWRGFFYVKLKIRPLKSLIICVSKNKQSKSIGWHKEKKWVQNIE